MQFILIEPDIKRVGWGIVKFCDLMQVSILSNLHLKVQQIFAENPADYHQLSQDNMNVVNTNLSNQCQISIAELPVSHVFDQLDAPSRISD